MDGGRVMLSIENDVISTSASVLAENLAKIVDLQAENTRLNDKYDVTNLNLQIATQQVALYRADAVEAAAALRQERVMFWALMAALLVSAGGEHDLGR